MKMLAKFLCVILLAVGIVMYPRRSDGQATPAVPQSSSSVPTPTSADTVVFTECESGRCDGTWKLNGTGGTAEWMGPIKAGLRIMELSETNIVIRRFDTLAQIPGLTAIYRGNIKGRNISGTVIWTCSGVGWPNNQKSGQWSAKLVSGSMQNLAAGPPFK